MFDSLQNIPGWLAVVISTAALIYTIVDGRGKKTSLKFKSIETRIDLKADSLEVAHIDERVDRLEDRATKIEAKMDHLPSKDATHRLEISLSKMEGEMATLAERIKPIAAVSARLQEKLIESVNIGGGA